MKNTKIQNSPKQPKFTPRGQGALEKQKIELRRLKVFELSIKGLTQARIAEALKVSPNTIKDDLTAIRKGLVDRIEKLKEAFNPDEFWGERYEELRLRKKEMYVALTESKSDRTMVIRALKEIDEKIDKALMSIGIKISEVESKDEILTFRLERG